MALSCPKITKLKPRILFQFGSWCFECPSCHFYGAFKDNIHSFLNECCKLQSYNVLSMPVWCVKVKGPDGLYIPLYTIEEDVEKSTDPFCKKCSLTGWGHHYLSKRQYHFVVPQKERWEDALTDNVFRQEGHILRAMIHCNGYGHLLSINGVEQDQDSYCPVQDSSAFPCEEDAMNLWDCLCSLLHPREISVIDLMDLKVFHVLTFGNTWFEKWGYKFKRGTFGIDKEKFEDAVKTLGMLEIGQVRKECTSTGEGTIVMQFLANIALANKVPMTRSNELLRFSLSYEASIIMDSNLVLSLLARRSQSTVQDVQKLLAVVVRIMKKKKHLSRQQLQHEIRKCRIKKDVVDIVMDYVHCFKMGDEIFWYSLPSAEFKVGEVPKSFSDQWHDHTIREEIVDQLPMGKVLDEKLLLLYSYAQRVPSVNASVQTILRSTCFVKEWPIPVAQDMKDSKHSTALLCKFFPSFHELEKELKRPLSPAVVVIVPLSSTIAELQITAQSAFRDTYCITKNLAVSQIGPFKKIEEDKLVCETIDPSSPIWVRGSGLDLGTTLRYADGDKKINVNCCCGTKFDDGERLAACVKCGLSQHTRCNGIADNEDAPSDFPCSKCKAI